MAEDALNTTFSKEKNSHPKGLFWKETPTLLPLLSFRNPSSPLHPERKREREVTAATPRATAESVQRPTLPSTIDPAALLGAMAGGSRGGFPAWMTAAAARVDLSGGGGGDGGGASYGSQPSHPGTLGAAVGDQDLGMVERSLSAASAAFISAIIVNPLDVAKVWARSRNLSIIR
jgi:hypothetical protein